MSTQTKGWQHDTWVEVACWSDMPEIRVGLHVEVELWTRWAEPQFHFARRHFQGPDGLPGHGVREVVKFQHEVARPLWEAAARDYSSLLPRSVSALGDIDDPIDRDLMSQLLSRAVKAGVTQFYKLFDCHYASWMLPLWLCHGEYCSSAARAMGVILDIDGCTPPGDSAMDQMFLKFFKDEANSVVEHCSSWGLNVLHHCEIKQMANHTEVHY